MTLYLIAHICRKEPTFDVAERLPCHICQGGYNTYNDWCAPEVKQDECTFCDSEGEYWIDHVSGHTPKPYWSVKLMDAGVPLIDAIRNVPPAPKDWPDYYSCNDRDHKPIDEPTQREHGTQLLLGLGLLKKVEIKRRV